MDNLTAADLFSPSKALQQRALTQDWLQIESWLSAKYPGRPIPSFERNEATLKALRELCIANERADEDRAVRIRLQSAALAELDNAAESQDPSNTELLNLVESHLSPSASTALDALARTTTALNLPTPDSTLIAHTLIAHTATAQSLTNHLAHIEALHSALQAQHAALRQKLAALQNDPAFTTPPHLPRQTVELGRQAKGLRAKVKEAEERVGVLERAAGTGSGSGGGYGHARNRSISSHSRTLSNPMSSYPSSTASHHKAGSSSPFDGGVADAASSAQAIEEMLAQQEALESLRRRVEALEGKVEEFAGLPADREGARKEVGKLEVELDALRRKRDGLFGGLLEGGGRR